MQQMLRLMFAALVAVALAHSAAWRRRRARSSRSSSPTSRSKGSSPRRRTWSRSPRRCRATADKPDPKIQAELEGIAKKHGFASFAEYDDVAATISMMMAGIDPQTKAFTEPKVAIQKEIEEVKNDKTIPENEKKQMLEELNEALKSAQPIQYPSNIELVKKYFDKIDAVLQ